MAIDEDTKRKIIDLYFSQSKPIRHITNIVKKSSRDIIAVVKEHKQRLRRASKQEDSISDEKNQAKEGKPSNYPINAKAYRLFSQGQTPLQVTIELGLSEMDATRYFIEYHRLKRLPELANIIKELKVPRKISLFIQLTKLALAENMRVTEILQLLKMANARGMYNIEQNIRNCRLTIESMRQQRYEKSQELLVLNNKIDSAKGYLNQYNLALEEKKEELAAVLESKIKYERIVELFKQNNETFLEIHKIAEGKVRAFLAENNGRKLLEFALSAVTQALRLDPQRGLLIQKTPSLESYDFNPNNLSFPELCDYNYPTIAKEKVLEISGEVYHNLVEGLTDITKPTFTEKHAKIDSY
jgi:hypothetical protein